MKISKAIATLAIIGMPYTGFADSNLETRANIFYDSRTGTPVEIESSKLTEHESWAHDVIEKSKAIGYALVVDKLARRMDLYFKGSLVDSFFVSLSQERPLEAKLYEDDGRVPEGIYNVTVKKDIGESKFHRAFMLNYPSRGDWKKFKEAKKNGIVPREIRRPGRHIEIHGWGDNSDWTDGCIALRDGDIDSLFYFVRSGTPVAIVKTYNRK